jgi:hypothetical protein
MKRSAPLHHKAADTQLLVKRRPTMSRTPAPAAIVSDGTLEGFIRRYCIVEKYDGMRASVQDAAKSRVVVDSGPPYKPINDDPLPLQQLVAVHKVVCTDPAKRQGTLDMLGYGVVAVLLERLFRHPQRSGAAVKDKVNSLRKRGLVDRLV